MTSLVYPLAYSTVAAATLTAARFFDADARIYTYQDDMELVCTIPAVSTARAAYREATRKANLRPNAGKDTLALGRGINPMEVPNLDIKVSSKPVVLKHAGPMPLPILPATRAAEGSLIAEGGEECAALIAARRRFLVRLRDLHGAGLDAQIARALAQARTGGDCTYVARTCGIPASDATVLDTMLEEAVVEFMGDGPCPDNVDHMKAAHPEASAATSRTVLPFRLGGDGFQSVRLTARRRFGSNMTHLYAQCS